jgi:hypothetical protein
MTFELIALLCTAPFAGACFYVSVVEHPARLDCGTDVALAQWRPSYRRAAAMQVTLAVGGLLTSVAAYASGRRLPALLGGLVARWSTRGRHVPVSEASHCIHADGADLVSAEVRRVVDDVRALGTSAVARRWVRPAPPATAGAQRAARR